MRTGGVGATGGLAREDHALAVAVDQVASDHRPLSALHVDAVVVVGGRDPAAVVNAVPRELHAVRHAPAFEGAAHRDADARVPFEMSERRIAMFVPLIRTLGPMDARSTSRDRTMWRAVREK